MTDPLVVKNLTKRYVTKEGPVEALKGISFSVKKGEIFGFLGPNGAGKSTTINILTGIIHPDEGDVLFFGKPRDEYSQNRINTSTAFTHLSNTLTVNQNLRVYAKLYGVQNSEKIIERLIREFGLVGLENRKYDDLSSGQKTKANLCKALINSPEILFLDEATASLDPDVAASVRKSIAKLNTTIIFTSHIMSEVEELCDRVAFIKDGVIVAIDTPARIKRKLGKKTLEEVFIHIARNQL